jgi:hypothetical protein
MEEKLQEVEKVIILWIAVNTTQEGVCRLVHGAQWIFLKLQMCLTKVAVVMLQGSALCQKHSILHCGVWRYGEIISRPVWVMTVAAFRNANDKATCNVVARELFFLFLFGWLDVGSCSGHSRIAFTLIYWTLQVLYMCIHMYLVIEPLVTIMTVMLTRNKLLCTLKMMQDKLGLKN